MDSLEDFISGQGLPPELQRIYEELNKKGYSKETEEEFTLFALAVAKFHREQVEGEDQSL